MMLRIITGIYGTGHVVCTTEAFTILAILRNTNSTIAFLYRFIPNNGASHNIQLIKLYLTSQQLLYFPLLFITFYRLIFSLCCLSPLIIYYHTNCIPQPITAHVFHFPLFHAEIKEIAHQVLFFGTGSYPNITRKADIEIKWSFPVETSG